MYIVSFIYDEEKMAVTLYNVPHSNSNIRPLNFTLLDRISHVTIPSFLFLFISATKIQVFGGIYV